MAKKLILLLTIVCVAGIWKDLKAQDPTGRTTGNIVKQKEAENIKLNIQQLESDRDKLKAAIVLNPSPIFKAATLIKVKDIQKQIDKLKKQTQ
jgi:hypothetical protein